MLGVTCLRPHSHLKVEWGKEVQGIVAEEIVYKSKSFRILSSCISRCLYSIYKSSF